MNSSYEAWIGLKNSTADYETAGREFRFDCGFYFMEMCGAVTEREKGWAAAAHGGGDCAVIQ